MIDVDLLEEAVLLCRHIVPRRTGFYVPAADSEGVLAVLYPVIDAHDEIIDLAAWQPDRPERWWLRTGAGVVLDEQTVQLARDYRLPVRLVPAPAQWLAEYETNGQHVTVCVLQRDRARAALRGVQILREGPRHAA